MSALTAIAAPALLGAACNVVAWVLWFLKSPHSALASALASTCYSVSATILGLTGASALFGLVAGVCAAIWWLGGGGRRGRQAARELGAKSKARVEALVRQMTPSPTPAPAGAR